MSKDKPHGVNRRTFVKAAGAAGGAVALPGLTATPGREPGPKDGEVLVGVSRNADPAGTVEAHLPAGAEVVHENGTLGYVAVAFPDATDAARRRFVEAVTDDPEIEYAEPNATYRALYTPNDPYYSQQSAPRQVNADDAWDTLLGDCGTKIAFVDTGVQYDHPDLSYCSNPTAHRDFVDDDLDAYPDDPSSEYHGTAMAGIAAAKTDNGTGIAGITDASLLFGRALDENGSGSLSDISDAIQWAADQGAHVINLSFGGGGYTSTMKNAVSYAYQEGALLVGAAGNDGPCTDCVNYPAAYDEVLAVAALAGDNSLASYSSTGEEIELAAPGTDVLTTTTTARGSYERVTGTSIAAAIVSGVAGLTHSRWTITDSELRRHLKATAVDEGLTGSEQGCGRVDADNAVDTDPADSGTCAACGDRSVSETKTGSLSGSGDTECWVWNWQFADPCEIVIELDGPLLADFDLYFNHGKEGCPTTSDYTQKSDTSDGQVTFTFVGPDTSTPLSVTVASEFGSGDYTLTFTEKAV